MADQLNVKPADIRAAGDAFNTISQTATDIWGGFYTALTSLGNFYGDDKVGQVFSQQFQPAVDAARDLLSGIGIGMGQTGSDLGNTAALYTKADDVNTDMVPEPTHVV
jgi:hypothetical protein